MPQLRPSETKYIHINIEKKKKDITRGSLVAQGERIHLPMQETHVQPLGQKDPTCLGATKPVHFNY